MNLYEHREAIVSDIRAGFDKNTVREVLGHRGKFKDLSELKNIATRNPAIAVAFWRFRKAKPVGDKFHAEVDWSAWVLTRGKRNEGRDDEAAEISQGVMSLIAKHRSTWGTAENISGGNLTALNVDRAGFSVWMVAWTRLMELDNLHAPSIGPYAGYEGDHQDEDGNTVIQSKVEYST